jgi:hypothetical protein
MQRLWQERIIAFGKLERIRKEAVVNHFKIISPAFAGRDWEESWKRPVRMIAAIIKIQKGTSQIHVISFISWENLISKTIFIISDFNPKMVGFIINRFIIRDLYFINTAITCCSLVTFMLHRERNTKILSYRSFLDTVDPQSHSSIFSFLINYSVLTCKAFVWALETGTRHKYQARQEDKNLIKRE